MVAVAPDHAFQESQVLGVDAGETVLIDNEHAFAVADVEQGGRHGIV